jgi:hypothetical protein
MYIIVFYPAGFFPHISEQQCPTLELGLPLRKTPLVYDIQELFRWLVDVSVLLLLEEKKLKKYD